MIDRERLTQDLQKLVGRLEADLRDRVATTPELRGHLEQEWRKGKDARRTSEAFEVWAEGAYTQSAVSWVLACVFVRYLEDNEFLDRPYLSGPGARAGVARDHRMEAIKRNPRSNERDYLQGVFDEVGRLPAMAHLLADRTAPHWSLPLSADGAKELYEFWQKREASGAIAHEFNDPSGDTRFLGDLYQELSEAAQRRYALLQTPVFVEEFVLDRTLDPAIEEFGLATVTLIDPTCGSGHFLLGAFARLFNQRSKVEPATSRTALAQSVLHQVAGVDLNPYAVAITRFRLLLAALRASGVRRLSDAPSYHMSLAAGDSLLHGGRPGRDGGRQAVLVGEDRLAGAYETEDAASLRSVLGRTYHVVVGNPPYITVKDRVLGDEYRRLYGSCHLKFALSVPFTERFFDLAIAPPRGAQSPAGFVGMLTSNSFMKREFGAKLVEDYLPRWDLTTVLDTAGAYIPGHGTPTVILVARNRRPSSPTVRAALGIRGEPCVPEDPARGLVWAEIVSHANEPSFCGTFVSIEDLPRETLSTHPWSLGGGGAAGLKAKIDHFGSMKLADYAVDIGPASFPGVDDVFVMPDHAMRRLGVPEQLIRAFCTGERVRDWAADAGEWAIAPYDRQFNPVAESELGRARRHFWVYRTSVGANVGFGGQTRAQAGDPHWTWYRWIPERFRNPLSIVFAFVATHNHFVMDRGGKVFKQTAPIIKLRPDATDDDHHALLGPLNSAVGCFWLKQVCSNKGVGGIGGGIADEAWEVRYEFDATKLRRFPIRLGHVGALSRRLDQLAFEDAWLLHRCVREPGGPTEQSLSMARSERHRLRGTLIALQEELDWLCYQAYGLLDEALVCAQEDLPLLRVGERAFELIMAKQMATGGLRTAWFERHGASPVYEPPSYWSESYRDVVRRRIEAIEKFPEINLIERPENKRRWSEDSWEEQERRALRGWLLDRLESPKYWPQEQMVSTSRLADAARHDADFLRVAGLYGGTGATFDVEDLVRELVVGEAVPYLAVYRYTASGLTKRGVWERTWELQRREDAIDARVQLPAKHPKHLTADNARDTKAREVGEVDVPPRYDSKDFRGNSIWQLRGKLDVPKERFILFPGAERDADPSPVVGWAGWDHLQRAKALAAYLLERVERDGWGADRVTPLLAGIEELLPWIKQWHNEVQPDFGMGMGDYFERFLDEQVRSYGLARETLRAWVPPTIARRSGKRKRSDDA